nr:unnamed protein product [Spirometra erinaceieuropaei]
MSYAMQKKHAKLTGRKFSRRERISCPGTSTVLGSPDTTKISTNKENNSFLNSGSLGGETTAVMPDESEFVRDTTSCIAEECEVLVNNVTVTEVANSSNGNGEKMSQNVTQQTRPLEEKNTGEEIWRYKSTEVQPLSHMPRGDDPRQQIWTVQPILFANYGDRIPKVQEPHHV